MKRESKRGGWGVAVLIATCVTVSGSPASAANAKDLYAKLRAAALPAGSATFAGSILFPAGEAATTEAELQPAVKLGMTVKLPKAKYELQTLSGSTKPQAVIQDGERLWLLTAVGATELSKIPDKAQDPALRLALILESDGGAPKLGGEETIGGKAAQALDLPYFGQTKRVWVEKSSSLPLRAELDGVRYDWVYDGKRPKVVRRIVGRDASGAVRIAVYLDAPVKVAKLDDGVFDFNQTKSRVGFFEKVGNALGGKPEVMASAGARGLDEEIKTTRSGKGGENYQAVEKMEQVIVTSGEVEEFLREGHLGKYSE